MRTTPEMTTCWMTLGENGGRAGSLALAARRLRVAARTREGALLRARKPARMDLLCLAGMTLADYTRRSRADLLTTAGEVWQAHGDLWAHFVPWLPESLEDVDPADSLALTGSERRRLRRDIGTMKAALGCDSPLEGLALMAIALEGYAGRRAARGGVLHLRMRHAMFGHCSPTEAVAEVRRTALVWSVEESALSDSLYRASTERALQALS